MLNDALVHRNELFYELYNNKTKFRLFEGDDGDGDDDDLFAALVAPDSGRFYSIRYYSLSASTVSTQAIIVLSKL